MAVLSGRSGVVSGATSFPQSYSAPQPRPSASRIVTAPPAISDAVSAISGLSARWRADQVVGLANGDPVTSWPDTSGNGYAATQGSPGNRPTWQSGVINGHPVLRFAAASNQALTASAPAGLDAQTVFAVVKMASTTGERTIRGGAVSGSLQFRVATGGALNLVKQSIANIGSSSGTVGTTAFQSVAATFDQTADTYAFYIDGVASGGGTTTQSLSADTTVIGTHPFAPTEAFDGDIAELIVWDRVLTSTELATVQTYIDGRYTPAPPAQVIGLTANSRTDAVDLWWTASSAATSYKVLRGGTQVGTTTGTLFSDYGGTVGVSATYTIVASNSAGDGTASAGVSAAPLATTAPLATWRAALASQASSPAAWMAVGDSITEGQGASARANRWIDLTRDQLRTALGITGGVGYLPGWYATYGPDSGWQPYSSRSGTINNNDWGADLGERFVSLATGASQTWTVTGTHADIWYMTNGGTFTWAVDGGSTTAVDTAGIYHGDNRARISLGAAGSHTVTVTCTTGPARIGGVAAFNGDQTTGLHLYDAGHTGYSSSQFVDDIPGQTDEHGRIAALAGVDLVTIALGANDWSTGATAATLKANVQTLIMRLRVHLPTASFVVVVAYERGDLPSGGWAPYRSALLEVVSEDSTLGVIDFFASMGRATTSGSWRTDGIHPSDAGHAVMATEAATYLAPAATSAGSGSGSWSFAGSGSGKRTPKATGTGAWSFTGTGTGTSTHRGTGTGSWAVTGAGTGTTTRRGTGSGSFAFAGSGTGKRVAKATGFGSWSFVGTGTGATVRRGSGSGTATWTGSGSGVAPLVGVNDGSGSGSWGFVGTGVGRRAPVGTGSGLAVWTGTGAGVAPVVGAKTGTGSGTWTVAGAGSGIRQPKASGGGAWAYVGTGAGVTPPEPGAARDITLSIGPGRSRTLTATAASSRELAAVGRSRTLTIDPRE